MAVATAVRWAVLWALAGGLLGVLSLTGGGIGHLGGWMAPVALGAIMGGTGAVGGVLYRLTSAVGRGAAPAATRALLGGVCGAVGVLVVGSIPATGIALGWSWPLLLGVGMGLVSGLASAPS